MVLARVPNQVAWKRTAPVFFFLHIALGCWEISLEFTQIYSFF